MLSSTSRPSAQPQRSEVRKHRRPWVRHQRPASTARRPARCSCPESARLTMRWCGSLPALFSTCRAAPGLARYGTTHARGGADCIQSGDTMGDAAIPVIVQRLRRQQLSKRAAGHASRTRGWCPPSSSQTHFWSARSCGDVTREGVEGRLVAVTRNETRNPLSDPESARSRRCQPVYPIRENRGNPRNHAAKRWGSRHLDDLPLVLVRVQVPQPFENPR